MNLVQKVAINKYKDTKEVTCPHLHNGGVITWANEIAWIVPHQLAEGHLVSLLHSFPQFSGEILGAWALETVGPLPVDGIDLHVVWCEEGEESEGQAQAVQILFKAGVPCTSVYVFMFVRWHLRHHYTWQG